MSSELPAPEDPEQAPTRLERRSWKGDVIINMLGRTSSVLIVFLVTPIFVRLMGLEGFALVGFFITLLGFIFVLDFAVGATMTRSLVIYATKPELADEGRDLARSLEYVYLAVSIALAVICVDAAPWIATKWLRVQSLTTAEVCRSIELMGICIALQTPIGMYNGALYGLGRLRELNVVAVVLSVLRYGGAALALWLIAPTPVVFFWWQLTFASIQLALLGALFWRFLWPGSRRPRFSRKALASVGGFASGMLVTAITSAVVNQLDKIVLSRLILLPQIGSYQLATQVSNGVRLVPSLIDSAILPRLSLYVANGDEVKLRRTYHQASQLVAFLSLPLAAVLIIFAKSVIFLWIGSRPIAEAAGIITALLVGGSALNCVLRVPYAMTVARGWSLYGVYEGILTLIVFVPLLVVLTVRYGAIGAASAWLIVNIGFFFIGAAFIHYRTLRGEYLHWLALDVAGPLLLSFAIAAAGGLLVPQSLPAIATVALIGIVWLVATAACLAVLPHPRHSIAHLLKKAHARFAAIQPGRHNTKTYSTLSQQSAGRAASSGSGRGVSRHVVILSQHVYESDRRAGFHWLTDAYVAAGWHASFITVGISRLSHLRNDYRLKLNCAKAPNHIHSIRPNLDGLVWLPIFHPLNLHNRLANRLSAPLFRTYGRLPLGVVEPLLRQADTVIVECSSGLALVPRIRKLAPLAYIVYRVSDDLRVLAPHPVLLDFEREALPYFDLLSVPSEYMLPIFPPDAPVAVHHHGIDSSAINLDAPNPYARGRNVVAIGTMLFDHQSVATFAEACPETTIHIFGAISDTFTQANVILYGEKPFRELVPYIVHADAGLAPYLYRPGCEYLADTSNKIMQYTYCRLAVLLPDFIPHKGNNIVHYKPGDPYSARQSLERACAIDHATIDRSSLWSWTKVYEAIEARQRPV